MASLEVCYSQATMDVDKLVLLETERTSGHWISHISWIWDLLSWITPDIYVVFCVFKTCFESRRWRRGPLHCLACSLVLWRGVILGEVSQSDFLARESRGPCLFVSPNYKGLPTPPAKWVWNQQTGCVLVSGSVTEVYLDGKCKPWATQWRETEGENSGSAAQTSVSCVCEQEWRC
jgi:hypothetical protein